MNHFTKNRRGWKIYLVALSLFVLVTTFAGRFDLWDLVFGLPLLVLTLVPLYGFAWQRRQGFDRGHLHLASRVVEPRPNRG